MGGNINARTLRPLADYVHASYLKRKSSYQLSGPCSQFPEHPNQAAAHGPEAYPEQIGISADIEQGKTVPLQKVPVIWIWFDKGGVLVPDVFIVWKPFAGVVWCTFFDFSRNMNRRCAQRFNCEEIGLRTNAGLETGGAYECLTRRGCRFARDSELVLERREVKRYLDLVRLFRKAVCRLPGYAASQPAANGGH